MKKQVRIRHLICVCFVSLAASAFAATTIDHAHPYAYSANTGWINAEGDTAHGAVIGESYCSGYIYSANCGWIALGAGSPTNGWHYNNTTANDWGVNHDGHGNLTGYAYGANIGWINFEQTYGQPKIDLSSGNLSGSIWSANTGWISLSNAQAYVRTETLDAGPDSDADGIPDPWEYRETGNLATLSGNGHDQDGDGASDAEEYAADTDPTDSGDRLEITAFTVNGDTNNLTWTVKTTRQYTLEQSDELTATNINWTTAIPAFIPSSEPTANKTITGVTASNHFYRVKAKPPLN